MQIATAIPDIQPSGHCRLGTGLDSASNAPYRALEARIDDVKHDTAELKTTIHQVHDLVHKMADRRTTQLIGWGIGIIGFLTAALGYMVTHYVLK